MTQHPDMPGLWSPEIFRTALEILSTGVVLLDRKRRIFFWNEGAERITGYQRLEAVGQTGDANMLAQCHGESCVHCGAACPLSQCLHHGKLAETHGYLHHKAGHSVAVHLRVNPIRDDRGSLVAIAASFDEEVCSPEPNFRDHNLAAHGCLDLISGVPNRAYTQSHLRENLAFFEEYHLPFGVLRIEMRGTDELRATHGMEAVDVMLHVVAQTMKHTLRPDGFLGRWTEDQFLALVTNCGSADLERVAQNVQKMAGCSGIQWWDDLLSVNVSVGRAMVQAGDTMESLLERAQTRPRSGQNSSAAAASSGGRSSAES